MGWQPGGSNLKPHIQAHNAAMGPRSIKEPMAGDAQSCNKVGCGCSSRLTMQGIAALWHPPALARQMTQGRHHDDAPDILLWDLS